MAKKLFTETVAAVSLRLDVLDSEWIKLTASGLAGGEQIEILDFCNQTSGIAIANGTDAASYIETTNNPRTLQIAGEYIIEKPATASPATVYASHERGDEITDVISFWVV